MDSNNTYNCPDCMMDKEKFNGNPCLYCKRVLNVPTYIPYTPYVPYQPYQPYIPDPYAPWSPISPIITWTYNTSKSKDSSGNAPNA